MAVAIDGEIYQDAYLTPAGRAQRVNFDSFWPDGAIPLLFPCSAGIAPLFADLIPLFGRVAEFASQLLIRRNILEEKSGFFEPGMLFSP